MQQSNHFKDHLKRVQGAESTNVEQSVIDAINAELDKRGANRALVTPADIRLILKLLKKNKLYNHTIRIWSMITMRNPPTMTSQQEMELMSLFTMIQPVWNEVRPKNRKSKSSRRLTNNIL